MGKVRVKGETGVGAGAELASKAQALPKVRKEWLGESEDLGKGELEHQGVAQLRTMYLPRTDRWAESGRERTDERQANRQRARELSLEARVEGRA